MKFKKLFFIIGLIIILIPSVVGLTMFVLDNFIKLPKPVRETIKPYYRNMSEIFNQYSIEVPGQLNFSFYAEFNQNNKKDYYFATTVDSFVYKANKNQIISVSLKEKDYSLINTDFPFLNRKEKLVPYLNAVFLIKIIYLFETVKFRTFLTDALRTYQEQVRYSRHGWTTVDKSPHMVGIAADMGRYFSTERKIIESESELIGLRFLQHGRRGNVHIHLQDNSIWYSKDLDNNLIELSGKMHDMVEKTYNGLIGYEKFLSRKFFSTKISDKSYPHSEAGRIYKLVITTAKPVILRSEIFDVFNNKIATFHTGIFKHSNNTFFLNTEFLSDGVYRIKHYLGNKLYKEDIIKRY